MTTKLVPQIATTARASSRWVRGIRRLYAIVRRRRDALGRGQRRLVFAAHLAQEVGQRAARFVAEDLVEHVQRAHAVDAEAAERGAVLAPGGERPDGVPVVAAQRPGDA